MRKDQIPPAFMPAPEHCEMRCETPIGGVVVVDTVVCHWYCDVECREYTEFHKDQVAANRKRRKARGASETGERLELEL